MPDQRSVDELATPNAKTNVAAARERALQRLFEEKLSQIEEQRLTNELRRRDFLRVSLLGVVGVGALSNVARRASASESWQDTKSQRDGDAVTSSAHLVELGSFGWDNLLFQIGSHACARIIYEHDLPLGNAAFCNSNDSDKQLLRRRLELWDAEPSLYAKVYRDYGWAGPCFEELVFRVAPSLLVSGEGAAWQVGIPLSIAHAATHNLVPNQVNTKRAIALSSNTKFSLDYVPLPQFILGAFCWYTARRYGELAPLVAHVFNNQAGAISLVLGGRRDQIRFTALLEEELAR